MQECAYTYPASVGMRGLMRGVMRGVWGLFLTLLRDLGGLIDSKGRHMGLSLTCLFPESGLLFLGFLAENW